LQKKRRLIVIHDADVAIPTGIPIVYKFDKNMESIPPSKEENSVSQVHMNGLFLEKPGMLKQALKREDEWARAIPGYDSTMSRHNRPMTSLERSLYKLNAVRELGEWASEFIDADADDEEDDGQDGKFTLDEDKVWEQGIYELEHPDSPVFDEASASTSVLASDEPTMDPEEAAVVPTFFTKPCVTSMPSSVVFNNDGSIPIRRDSVIVIIRHGKTQHNKLGLFTGWVSWCFELLWNFQEPPCGFA
jgi:hypothetical protein